MGACKVFGAVSDALARGEGNISVTGLWGSSSALFLWELAEAISRPVLVLSPTPKEAQALVSDFAFFAGKGAGAPGIAYFPPYDVLPYDVIAPDPAVVALRLATLARIAEGSISVVVAPVKAFMQRLPAPASVVGEGAFVRVVKGSETPLTGLIARLSEMGYNRAAMVYEPGEFSVRGGILDVFPPGVELPVRVEFFGDTAESIRAFDPDTQRSTGELEDVTILPANEGKQGASGTADIRSYFSSPPLMVFEEPGRIKSLSAEFLERVFSSYSELSDPAASPAPEELYLTDSELSEMLDSAPRITLEVLPLSAPLPGEARFEYATQSVEVLRLGEHTHGEWPEDVPKTQAAVFCRNLGALAKGRAVNVVSHTGGQAERLREIFAEHGLPAEAGRPVFPGDPDYRGGVVSVSVGSLGSGFVMDTPGLAFVTARELFGEKPKGAPVPRAKVERFLTSLSELSPGDMVVHFDHGIGRYEGLKRLTLLGVETDFIEVSYQGSDRLYVPVDELGKLQKYIGAEEGGARLDRLGGGAWERTKARAKKAADDMAGELLELYAARAAAPGFAYSPDDHLYREMESSFEYEETPDQARAIEDVKKDLEAPHPMDRLVCGDVGYGKTEVAVRAAFKVALDGKQAAILAPTTLLANQHYETFRARLAAFPVRVEALSRFTPKERVKDIISGIKAGTVDIVIGTHRMLQKDVEFGDLGLVIIDEEHRFGVRHKERLKKMRKEVDVLTLTATPIPRTLNMSLSGIRDLSIIETPPPDRLPIKTIVTRFDRAVIKEAVARELMRGGQVFFVHNRIETIFAVGQTLSEILPDARMAVAHGRMGEAALEKVMRGFVSGEIDLLLSTAIIESGLDIPQANTIIINRADKFGLADLYQLRGRVGRSRVRAYAYLLVPGEDNLTEAAQKRLRVISEIAGLGAGFRLALHDLEIRGAGDVLGSEQSGHIAAVGFDLYTRMLEDAVKKLKGEEVEEAAEPALDLKVSAFIPEDYVPDTAHRLGIYKRMSGVRSEDELTEMAEELADRYGPPPAPAVRLIEVMGLKVMARAVKVAGIQMLPSEFRITFSDKVDIPPDRLLSFLSRRKGSARYVPQYTIYVKKPSGGWEAMYPALKNCLKELGGM